MFRTKPGTHDGGTVDIRKRLPWCREHQIERDMGKPRVLRRHDCRGHFAGGVQAPEQAQLRVVRTLHPE